MNLNIKVANAVVNVVNDGIVLAQLSYDNYEININIGEIIKAVGAVDHAAIEQFIAKCAMANNPFEG